MNEHAPVAATAMDTTVDTPAPVGRKWVTFRLGSETFALEVLQLREVLRQVRIEDAPGADSAVVGLINLRGEVVTVLDGYAMLGAARPAEPASDPRVMVLDAGAEHLALMVDAVMDVLFVEDDAVEGCPPGQGPADTRRILGVLAREDQLIMLVDACSLYCP